jgi:chemotaxis protein MotB
MKRERRWSDRTSHDRWLVSYADFVTLLFAFFVVLYASAQMDQRKAGRLSVAIESAFQQLGIFQTDGHKPGNIPHQIPLAGHRTPGGDQAVKQDLADIQGELETALAKEIKRNEVALHLEPDGLVISLREAGFFDSGSATMKAQAEDAFRRVAQILQEHPYGVRIEGHTDTVPIHTAQFASSWELSTARATVLVKMLIEQYGIAADRLSAAGYAEFHPVASNSNGKGRQLNRRVDVVILTVPLPNRAAAEPDPPSPAVGKTSPVKPPAQDVREGGPTPLSSGKIG